MSDVRLDHVVIAVTDWERANAFYRDVCGAELVRMDDGPSTYWRYRFGEQQLNVHGPGVDPAPVARVTTAPGSADLCLLWPGPIAAAAEHLRAHGVEVELGPVERAGARGPGMSVYFRDPDGALLEFISYA
jgi:catechol 2,3-dioxygenase-like lactoylglutathione lyase family enzyme